MLENLTPPPNNLRTCKVKTIMDQLDPADRGHLANYLGEMEQWSSNALSKALNARGIYVSSNTIHKHRTGGCSC